MDTTKEREIKGIVTTRVTIPQGKRVCMVSNKVRTRAGFATVGERFAVELCNVEKCNLYFGGSDVTAENGMKLAPGEHRMLQVHGSNVLYVAAAENKTDGCVILAEYLG